MAKFGTLVLLVILTLTGCATTPAGVFTVHTTALTDTGLLKKEYGGPSDAPASVRSFPLTWTGLPPNTKALALTLIDRDYSNYVHWLAADIDPESVRVSRFNAARNRLSRRVKAEVSDVDAVSSADGSAASLEQEIHDMLFSETAKG